MSASHRSNYYGALLFLDLDNFKPLNDLHDSWRRLLLIEVASRLKSCVREADTAARFGGDEFVVLLCDLNTDAHAATDQAASIAEKNPPKFIRTLLAQRRHRYRCTASIGVALFKGREVDGKPDQALTISPNSTGKSTSRSTIAMRPQSSYAATAKLSNNHCQ